MPAKTIFELAASKLKENSKKGGASDLTVTGVDTNNTPDERSKEDKDTYLLLFGSRECGKTSLLFRFLDRDEPAKSTIALEYTYGRRSRGNAKDVGHLWELGGGASLVNLINIPLSPATFEDAAMVLMLDLSKPEELWTVAESLLTGAKKRLDGLTGELRHKSPDLYRSLQQRVWNRIGADHQDKEMIKPFPIPLAIVGGKYDIFQDFDSVKKKSICKTLRFLAHSNGASLQFFSVKMEVLVTKGRALLSHLVFGTPGSKGLSTDHNKPLFVPVGSDSFQDIGVPTTESGSLAGAGSPLELWKNAFCAEFPQTTKKEIRDDPARDPQYKEEVIDLLRAQKDQELERYILERDREEAHRKKLEKSAGPPSPKRGGGGFHSQPSPRGLSPPPSPPKPTEKKRTPSPSPRQPEKNPSPSPSPRREAKKSSPRSPGHPEERRKSEEKGPSPSPRREAKKSRSPSPRREAKERSLLASPRPTEKPSPRSSPRSPRNVEERRKSEEKSLSPSPRRQKSQSPSPRVPDEVRRSADYSAPRSPIRLESKGESKEKSLSPSPRREKSQSPSPRVPDEGRRSADNSAPRSPRHLKERRENGENSLSPSPRRKKSQSPSPKAPDEDRRSADNSLSPSPRRERVSPSPRTPKSPPPSPRNLGEYSSDHKSQSPSPRPSVKQSPSPRDQRELQAPPSPNHLGLGSREGSGKSKSSSMKANNSASPRQGSGDSHDPDFDQSEDEERSER